MNGTSLSGSLLIESEASIELANSINNLKIDNIEKTLLVKLKSTQPLEIRGIVPGGNQLLYLFNLHRYAITLKNNHPMAAVENRIMAPADIVIQPDGGVTLIYFDNRWRSP